MKRFRGLFVMLLIQTASVTAAGIFHNCDVFHIAAALSLSVLFFVITVTQLELIRAENIASLNAYDDYRLFALVYSACCIAMAVFSFLPAYLSPVMVFAVVCMGIYRKVTGLALGIYFSVMCAILSGASIYVLICYILLVTFTSLLYALGEKKPKKLYVCVLLLGISVMVPVITEYLEIYRIDFFNMCFYLIGGICASMIYYFIDDKLLSLAPNAGYVRYDTILDESFHLVREIKNYSSAEYMHAKKVCAICKRIAEELGFDKLLSAAGGFYYRLGRMEGEPFVQNGVRLAEENGFPGELVSIISEYDGKEHLPSSKESALVHIVDSIVLRFEVMDKNTFSGGWNKDIMIYSAMNEYSESGLYDESGLSMNQFLKIRDMLTKEDLQ